MQTPSGLIENWNSLCWVESSPRSCGRRKPRPYTPYIFPHHSHNVLHMKIEVFQHRQTCGDVQPGTKCVGKPKLLLICQLLTARNRTLGRDQALFNQLGTQVNLCPLTWLSRLENGSLDVCPSISQKGTLSHVILALAPHYSVNLTLSGTPSPNVGNNCSNVFLPLVLVFSI